MELKDMIKMEENEFPKAFASFVEKDYGILFYDDVNKDSHDSNHAILFADKDFSVKEAFMDITNFYLGKHLTPRIYQPFQNGYFENHRELLESLGYQVQIYGYNRFMLLTDENNIKTENRLEIKRLLQWEERIANDIFIPAKEEYEIPVLKKIINQKNNYVFVGYLDGVAVTITYFHIQVNGCTRFDYILTAKDYREKGYARELLSYVVDYCKENGIKNCFQWPAHETSERICYEAGFRVLFEAEAGAAIYQKSRV